MKYKYVNFIDARIKRIRIKIKRQFVVSDTKNKNIAQQDNNTATYGPTFKI